MYFPVKKEVKYTPPPPSLGSRPRTFFGNQIFQFCFANSLKNKNLSITINTRDFERVARENSPLLTARKLVLPVEYFDFDETTNKEFKSYKFKKLIYESKFTKKETF